MNDFRNSTVKKYNKILTVKGYSENTIEVYSYYVSEFIIYFDKNIYHLNNKEIQEFFYNYKFTSKSQQNQFISSIKLLFKFIVNKKLDKINLERPRKEKHLPKVIDHDYIIKCLSSIKNTKHLSILSLAYSVGLRVSEVINLKINDIDSQRMVINIRQAKGRKDRIVPLSQSMLILLRKYYIEYKPYRYLFNGQKKLKYTPGSCNKIVKKYLGKEYHIHILRHSCFTKLLENGTDLRIIQKLAGHNSSKTTEIYTHVSNNLLQSIALPI